MKKYILILGLMFSVASFSQNITSKIENATPAQYELLKKDIESDLININSGAQILKRILKENQNKIDYKKLDKLKNKYDLNIITYDNNKLNSELIRFQTKENFIKKHKKLNKIGKKIEKI